MYMFGDVHHIYHVCIARYLQHYVNTQMIGALVYARVGTHEG